MVAIERPLIVYEQEGENNRAIGVWFEYGNRTRLYTVPYVPVAEQVCVVIVFSTVNCGRVWSSLPHTSPVDYI